MIINANIGIPGSPPPCPEGSRLLAAMDVEWSKNYRSRNGNVPFCYSVIWLSLRAADSAVDLDRTRFWYSSAYVDHPGQRDELVDSADAALACIMEHASIITGHQLCSDLAVLSWTSGDRPPAIVAASDAWRRRKQHPAACPRFIDTRYDTSHLLTGQSRRLVDICADLRLDVTQPELRSTSMTALHRRWLERRDTSAREKITVLNLRHSLSTAIVAACAAGLGCWEPGLNVNQVLASELGSQFAWLTHPGFTTLLGEPGAA